MSILTATNLAKSFGAQDIFADVNVSVAHADKIALVGPNGAGKTTLLRILIGLEEPTEGRVMRMRGLRVGYLPQDADLSGTETPWELCNVPFAELHSMQARLRRLEALLSDPKRGDKAMAQYGRLLEEFELAGGYTYEAQIKAVLGGLGLDATHMHRPMDQLSGGQRTRALLARLLLERPHVLVLDEPTNHLDLQAVEWLESYLQEWPEALIVVSHDRYFLDRVVHKVWELNFGRLEAYPGNYSHYVVLRAERAARRQAEWEAQQEFIARTEAFIRRYKAGQRSKEARGRQKRLERMPRLERPQRERRVHFKLESELRSGNMVLSTHKLVIGYDRPLLSVPDLELRRLERAAIIGPNGTGKTTFLKTVLGRIPPLSGEVRLGASLRIGYLDQERGEMCPENTIIEEVARVKYLPDGRMRDFLARFLFTGDDVFKKIADLSGGERCRVALAKLSLAEPNFLLLDEPTNQLDIASQEALEVMLRDFLGTVLFVSHDRYLIDALATQVWVIKDGQMRVYRGNYRDYLDQRQKEVGKRQEARTPRNRQPRRKTDPPPGPDLQEVEDKIEELERHLAELGEALSRAGREQNLDRVRTLGVEYQRAQAELDRLIAEWEALYGTLCHRPDR